MLPLGKKQVLKCAECSNTCHKECMPLVPNTCGLSSEMAYHMIREIETAEREMRHKDRMEDRSGDFHHPSVGPPSITSTASGTTLLPISTTITSRTPSDGEIMKPPVSPMKGTLQQAIYQPAPPMRTIGLEDFNFLAVLGKGNFGKVKKNFFFKMEKFYFIEIRFCLSLLSISLKFTSFLKNIHIYKIIGC